VADANVRFFGDDYNVGVGAGISEENDYESKTVHIQYQKENAYPKSACELISRYGMLFKGGYHAISPHEIL
jgi:hypothetical protein